MKKILNKTEIMYLEKLTHWLWLLDFGILVG